MKIILTLPALILSTFLYAQPDFNSLVVPGNNSNSTFTYMNYTWGVPAGGANQTWNYSLLNFTNAYYNTTTYNTDVASTPYASSFPTATHYIYNASINTYNYYEYSSTAQKFWGHFNSSTLEVLSDARTYMACPLAYTNVQTDAYSGTHDDYGTILYENGTATTSYEGYGTLITPTATINNIALIKVGSDATTTHYSGGNLVSTTRWVITEYVWMIPGEFFPRFGITYVSYYIDGVQDMSNSRVSLLVNSNVVSSTTAPELISATLSPQPASGQVSISAPRIEGTATAHIYKMDGVLVKREDLFIDGGNAFDLSLSGVNPGFYMVEVTNDNRIIRQKLIVKE